MTNEVHIHAPQPARLNIRRCQSCHEEKPAAEFLAGLCDACFSSGAPIPPGPMEQLTTKALVRLGKAHRTRMQHRETSCDIVEREEVVTMGSAMVACPICGLEVKRQGLGVHKARKHGGNGDAPRPEPAETVQQTFAQNAANGCNSCPFRGLESHIARVLVGQAVQAGMELEHAAQFVRSAQAAFGGK